MGIEGVGTVYVDLTQDYVTVVYDDTRTDVGEMEDALAAGGYPVEGVVFLEMPVHMDVSPQEALEMIDSVQDLLVLDVREADEYCDGTGHIIDAVNTPWNSGELQEYFYELDPTHPTLVVCGSGFRSDAASRYLAERGFTEVYDMTGGMVDWVWETEFCLETTPPEIVDTGSGGSGGCFISNCFL